MDIILDPVRWLWDHIVQVVSEIDSVLGTTLTVLIAIIIFVVLTTAIVAGREDKFEREVAAAGEDPGGDKQCDRALDERSGMQGRDRQGRQG